MMLDPTKPARSRRLFLAAAAVALMVWSPTLSARAQNAGDKTDTAKADTAQKSAPPVSMDEIDPNQKIGRNFVLTVSVAGEPDASGNYPVDGSGNINIRYAGIMTPVHVEGLKTDQARDAVVKVLKTYIKSPEVTVAIASVPHPTIFVSGAVRNTGPAIISKDTTLVELLSRAEWLESADLTQVRITHAAVAQAKPVVQTVNVEKYIKASANQTVDEAQNPALQDKDKIFVPFKNVTSTGTISVQGEVANPKTGVPLRSSPPLTVREAINLAGGINTGANRKTVTIRRAGEQKPLVVDYDKAEQGDLVNNIELKPDDAIYVEKLENNAFINVDGGFKKPGKLPYDKRTTLTQAISEAGGPEPNAKIKEGVIFRHPDSDPTNTKVIAFNWNDIMKGKAKDIELQPGDSVYITPGNTAGKASGDNLFSLLHILTSGAYLFNTFRK